MKKYILGILMGLILPILGVCQVSIDPTHTSIRLNLFVNKCFENLEYIRILDESPITRGIPFCNVAACLATLEYLDQDQSVSQAIFSRLEELSERLYQEGTPIILTMGCFSDDQLLNENRQGWLEVCLGNGCLDYGKFNKGIEIFNRKTRSLVRN